MRERAVHLLRRLLPEALFAEGLRGYHWCLAYLGALRYGFPSRNLFVIGVTGTKGKSTTVELIRAILREGGYTAASASTIQFCIGESCERNLFKMTMPGRFFLQGFLRKALRAGATHAVIEMTSEGAVQYRHKGIQLDALVFTNLAPEHLESHGGMEAYAAAKLSLAAHLERSPKRPRIMVANGDDAYGAQFLATNVEKRVPFARADAQQVEAGTGGIRFIWHDEPFASPLIGLFNLKNILAALSLAEAMGIPHDAMRRALRSTVNVSGRAEHVDRGQDFAVVVDYAHTPDSLRALYETFSGRRTICVLGNTGGGRDAWKRPAMGEIAEEHCAEIILTNEDPYDEDPLAIIKAMRQGMRREPKVLLDRREAIRAALALAHPGDAVLITGKGTDPYIMGPRGSKEVWSDREVAQEELDRLATLRSS